MKSICILGNSIAIKMRPKRAGSRERTFAEWLRSEQFDVYNCARSGTTIRETFLSLEEDVITRYPDFVVVSFGIVEAYPRATFRTPNNLAIFNYYNNRTFNRQYFPDGCLRRTISFVLRAFNFCTRRVAGFFSFHWYWESKDTFAEALEELCRITISETSADVILLPVLPIHREHSKWNIGAEKRISELNTVVRQTASSFEGRVAYCDLYDPDDPDALRQLTADGIHFTAMGHQHVSSALLEIIRSRSE